MTDISDDFKVPMRLLSGKIVDLDDLQEEDINIEHIATALSMQCRYNGQIPEFYSVAQHSMLVADVLESRYDKTLGLCGLLHDAAEAYIGDLVTPIKIKLPFFDDLEEKILERILKKYNIYHIYRANEPYIRSIDRHLYHHEVQYFFGNKADILGNIPVCDFIALQKAFFGDFMHYLVHKEI